MHARVKVTALALGAALSLSACSLAASITTSNAYDPSDGIGIELGDVSTENFLLISSGAGEPAALVGTLYNEGDEPARVVVTIGGDSTEIVVAPHTLVTLGVGEGEQGFITTSPVAAGGIAEVSVQLEGIAPVSSPIPVLDGTLEEYREVLDAIDGAAN